MSVLPGVLINNIVREGPLRRDVVNPFTEERIAVCATGDSKDINDAVNAAEVAFKTWSRLDNAKTRSEALLAFADAIDASMLLFGLLACVLVLLCVFFFFFLFF
jgi:acyl-CoA reductase-like NAD-dependent aldehyde dehydrogenase